jgi:Mg-chelatase subunit ChlD
MSTWLKKVYNAEGVTEYPTGPNLAHLKEKFGGSGAVVLCIDVSGSMVGPNLAEAKKGGTGFINDAAGGGYQVGLILWSTEIAASIAPTSDTAVVQRKLDAARVVAGTKLAPALELARSMLMAVEVTDRVCVVFTDGSLHDQREAERAAARLKADGIRILTIGLGSAAARGLNAIASEGPPTTASSTESLASDMQQLATGLVSRKKRK